MRRAAGAAALGFALITLAGCGLGADDGTTAADKDATTKPSASSTAAPTEPETRFFSDDSPWNARIDDATIDPASATLMSEAAHRISAVDTRGGTRLRTRTVTAGLYINTTSWTTPVVSGGVPTKVACRQEQCGDGEGVMTLDVPQDIDPDPRYDGWFTVVDESSHTAYDLWRARRESDGSLSYHYLRIWDLSGDGFGKPGQPSARGSGLPLAGGLIRPGELEAGLIDHALAISVPGPASGLFVAPASATDGNGAVRSLPEGARIRLKADVVVPAPIDPATGKPIPLSAQEQRYADAIAAALRTYGAIVVDRAEVPTLYAQRDVTATMLDGSELRGLHLSDFEVVELGTKHDYPLRKATS